MRNFEIKNNDCHAALAMTKSVQSGRSMIEMLGVLAIIGVLSVGGIAGYSKAMMKYRINKTIEQITLIAGNVRAFFAPQKSYDGFYIQPGCGNGCEVAHKAKLVPEEMMELNSNGKLNIVKNEFGGNVWGNSTGKNSSTDKQAFVLSFWSIPLEPCIELVSHDWTNAGVRAIYLTKSGPGSDVKYVATPVSVDDAVTYCSTIQYGGTTELNFFFDIDVNSTYWQGKINPSS